MHILLIKEKVVGTVVNAGIERSAGTAASEVAEGLLIYPPGKRTVEKVDDAENDMTDGAQQGAQK
jgi:hypothetical protein